MKQQNFFQQNAESIFHPITIKIRPALLIINFQRMQLLYFVGGNTLLHIAISSIVRDLPSKFLIITAMSASCIHSARRKIVFYGIGPSAELFIN